MPNKPTSTELLASALEISTPLGMTSTFMSSPAFENTPRSTPAKNGAFSAAEVTATRSCCASAGVSNSMQASTLKSARIATLTMITAFLPLSYCS